MSDVNDTPPTLINLPSTATVYENANMGFTVFEVNATDPDSGLGGIIFYSIISVSIPMHLLQGGTKPKNTAIKPFYVLGQTG